MTALPPLPVAEPGSYDRHASAFPSIAAFIRARDERLRSPERDLGLHWHDGEDLYRAAWIRDTGEVYLVQLGSPEHGGGHVELIAEGLEIDQLESALAGWPVEQDRSDRSLGWFRSRVRAVAAAARPRLRWV
jgi:hypothetical protein